MTHLMLAASVLSLAGSVIAETWTVDDDGPADFDNIQAAVDAAEHNDEIIVSPGTYTGDGNYVVNMNGKRITLRSSGSYLDTIIDGEATRGCIQCTSGEDAQTSIENFTLTGGLANDGGGILCMSSSPTLKDCLITSNAALVSGGGIFVSNGNPSLDNCRIYFNECPTFGGGLYLYNSNATIISTEIFYNDARNGGGLSCFASDNIRMARCHLFGNTADETGGGARIQSSKISLSFCSAVSNSCMQDGGGYLRRRIQ